MGGFITRMGRWYSRADSNRNRQNRNLKSYPLDYGSKVCENTKKVEKKAPVWGII